MGGSSVSFDLISLLISEVEHFPMCLISHLYIIFGETSIPVLCSVFKSGCLVVELQEFFIFSEH